MGILGVWLSYRKRSLDWGKAATENFSFEIRDTVSCCRRIPGANGRGQDSIQSPFSRSS